MPLQPMTHHEILGLVGPFARSGRHVDLATSDRLARRLVFRPVERVLASRSSPVHEVLVLENPAAGAFRLHRQLRTDDGIEAELIATGTEPGSLLHAVDAVPPHTQIVDRGGVTVARSYRLDAGDGRASHGGAGILTRAMADIHGLRASMVVPSQKGSRGELELGTTSGVSADLPEDLLAVLGRRFSPLLARESVWRGMARLRGRGSARSRDAEEAFDQLIDHLAVTLAEAPGRFHERFVAARWIVVLRRLAPILVSIALICGVLALPRLGMAENSIYRMLLFNAPPLMLVLVFSMRELPRFEIPPMPRRSAAASWIAPPAVVPATEPDIGVRVH